MLSFTKKPLRRYAWHMSRLYIITIWTFNEKFIVWYLFCVSVLKSVATGTILIHNSESVLHESMMDMRYPFGSWRCSSQALSSACHCNGNFMSQITKSCQRSEPLTHGPVIRTRTHLCTLETWSAYTQIWESAGEFRVWTWEILSSTHRVLDVAGWGWGECARAKDRALLYMPSATIDLVQTDAKKVQLSIHHIKLNISTYLVVSFVWILSRVSPLVPPLSPRTVLPILGLEVYLSSHFHFI